MYIYDIGKTNDATTAWQKAAETALQTGRKKVQVQALASLAEVTLTILLKTLFYLITIFLIILML